MSTMLPILSEKEALNAAVSLEQMVDDRLGLYLKKRSEGHKEAVIDFLFEYYAFRPIKLKIWSPGLLTALEKTVKTRTLLSHFKTIETQTNIALDWSAFSQKRQKHLAWVLALQKAIADKPMHFGCFGLHEWAMLYKSSEKRHPYLSLRVEQSLVDSTVEENPLKCSHYDAYRFFTEPAVPLNEVALSREEVLDYEQGGCIHNNMDLYKWCFKFYPWVSSVLLWDAFELALKARIVDMEASPYDVREYGYGAIKIEQAAGRKSYVLKQKKLAEEAVIIRSRLIKELSDILSFIKSKTKIANQV